MFFWLSAAIVYFFALCTESEHRALNLQGQCLTNEVNSKHINLPISKSYEDMKSNVDCCLISTKSVLDFYIHFCYPRTGPTELCSLSFIDLLLCLAKLVRIKALVLCKAVKFFLKIILYMMPKVQFIFQQY